MASTTTGGLSTVPAKPFNPFHNGLESYRSGDYQINGTRQIRVLGFIAAGFAIRSLQLSFLRRPAIPWGYPLKSWLGHFTAVGVGAYAGNVYHDLSLQVSRKLELQREVLRRSRAKDIAQLQAEAAESVINRQ
ncbi:hypothetical protein [Phaffia rhodozyma]|uniref:Uncharacterized protein n=1 Tax=Phaffia rhodozyma TaxID=264483 RepID=A0A0F7SHW2_PHARH|nr:hypothetical protein [Phaffia rhodozyma]